MSQLLQKLKNIHKNKKIRVCLPEFMDERILQAANQLLLQSLEVEIVFIEISKNLISTCEALGCQTLLQEKGQRFHILPAPQSASDILSTHPHLASSLPELSHPVFPLYMAAHLLAQGQVDVVLAGAVYTTADVIRAGMRLVGKEHSDAKLSGAFVMEKGDLNLIFTDCGVTIEPDEESLVQSAMQAVRLYRQLQVMGDEPRVAFLSFSTHGSAKHSSAEKMARCAKIFAERYPDVAVDGELQFDAAIDLEVGKRKAPASLVAGRANIFVFPDLNAGNIAYKIAQRLGGFSAYGPILLGLQKPYSDLSRGTSIDDIVASAWINARRIP
jgi:phosphate acetyltransferase